VKLPKNVIALDYGTKGDLYIRFKHADNPVGEPMKDGLAIFFYENGRRIVAVEIMDLSPFTK
jgi:hypothetical protein